MRTNSSRLALALILNAGFINAQEWRNEWSLRDSGAGDKVHFKIERRKANSNWSNSHDVSWSRFRGLTRESLQRGGSLKFEYVADAGKLICEGQGSGGRALGDFQFEGNKSFAAELSKLGYEAPDDNKLFEMTMVDVTLEFARQVKDAGLGATTKELVEMRIHGVTGDYIRDVRAVGYTQLRARDFVEMKIHGVQTDFIRELKAAGYDLPARQVIEMRIHGIDTEYIRQLKSYGLQPDARELVELKIHGTSPEYLKGMKDAGFTNLKSREIVEMRIHGVSPEFVKETRDLGYQFSTRELIEMKIHGVNSAYLKKLKQSGMKNLSAQQITQLKIHGIE